MSSLRTEFQHTAARRRLVSVIMQVVCFFMVSTHSRPKAAGSPYPEMLYEYDVSTHSRPKAAGQGRAD